LRFIFVNFAYCVALLLAAPWLIYQSLVTGKYRAGPRAKFLGFVPERTGDRPCLWVHAVSVGEVALADVLLKRLTDRWPQLQIVVSTTSKTGYELARQRFPQHLVTYAPLDFSWAIGRAFDRLRPDFLLLIELELWPNLIWTAQRRNVRTAIVNGRLSSSSYRGYQCIGSLVASVLRCFDFIAAANQEYADRFVELGASRERVITTGSIKFDGAEWRRDNARTVALRKLAGFGGDEVVLVAGSTQEPEEMMALTTFQSLCERFPKLRVLIVPRHPERFDHVARQLDEAGVEWKRRSQLDGSMGVAKVLLIDTVGELAGWWGLANIAFVGGSMGTRGGQNMIEPAAYGAAVCFGPNTSNFKEVTRLMLDRQAAQVVDSGPALTSFVEKCLVEPEWATRLGQQARTLVAENRGALDQTIELLTPALEGLLRSDNKQSTLDASHLQHRRGPHATRPSNANRLHR
jgi:3-deoxy-D-manno-octulosonic-acid transferase